MRQKKWAVLLLEIALVFNLAACSSGQQVESNTTIDSDFMQESSVELVTRDCLADSTSAPDKPEVSNETENDAKENMRFYIEDTEVSVTWEDNESVDALVHLVKAEPLVINMTMYGGFEQVGSLGESLPRNDEQISTSAGDIVLYSGNQIVVFYGSNSWAYTRLGKITDRTAAEMTDLLGSGNVAITISYGR